MSTFIRTNNTTYGGAEFQSKAGYLLRDAWTAPATASATAVLNATNLDGSTVTTFAGQPDFARALTLVASGATTANVVVNGTDIRNKVATETIALNGTTPVTTLRAFKTVTSIVLPSVASTTVNVGTSALLGLSRMILSTGDFFHGLANNVKEATAPTFTSSATEVSRNTVSFNSAPNSSRNLAIIYFTTELSAV